MHRIIVAIVFIAAAAAAERETFTLKDGRTLVGVYDENAQAITLDGKAHAVMPLRADQIKEREATPATRPAPERADHSAAESGEVARLRREADEARQEAANLDAKAKAEWHLFCRRRVEEMHMRYSPTMGDGELPQVADVLPSGRSSQTVVEEIAGAKRARDHAADLAAQADRLAQSATEATRLRPASTSAASLILTTWDADAADVAALEAAAQTKRKESEAKWFSSPPLPLLPVPALSVDPRQSEMDAARHVSAINDIVSTINRAIASHDAPLLRSMFEGKQSRDMLVEYERQMAGDASP